MPLLFERREDAQQEATQESDESIKVLVYRCKDCRLFGTYSKGSSARKVDQCLFCSPYPGSRLYNDTDLPREEWKQLFVKKHQPGCYYCGIVTNGGPLCDGHKNTAHYGGRFLRDLNQGHVK